MSSTEAETISFTHESKCRSVTPINNLSSVLRCSPWTVAEAEYAAAIIEGFDKGKLSDCSHHYTLRVYLSCKLNCSPMRVSKKLRGKKMGKCYHSNNDSTDIAFLMKLEKLRKEFIKSCDEQLEWPSPGTFVNRFRSAGVLGQNYGANTPKLHDSPRWTIKRKSCFGVVTEEYFSNEIISLSNDETIVHQRVTIVKRPRCMESAQKSLREPPPIMHMISDSICESENEDNWISLFPLIDDDDDDLCIESHML